MGKISETATSRTTPLLADHHIEIETGAGTSEEGTIADLFPMVFQSGIDPHSNGGFDQDEIGRACGFTITGLQSGETLSTLTAELRLGRTLAASDADYYNIEILKVGSAGAATGTSMMTVSGTPDTTKSTGGLYSGTLLSMQKITLGVKSDFVLSEGDYVYLRIWVGGGSPQTIHQRGFNFVMTGKRVKA